VNWKSGAAVAALGALIGGGAMMLAAPATAPNRGLDTAIRTYILNHPEIIQEAADKLQTRALAKVVDANRAAFESPFAGAWAGNRRGDVTLVEFFDYSCGYCRTSVPHIDRLLKEDPGLRVVYRELPVLVPIAKRRRSPASRRRRAQTTSASTTPCSRPGGPIRRRSRALRRRTG